MMLSTEGMLRALQPDVMTFTATIGGAFLILLLARYIIGYSQSRGAFTQEIAQSQRKTATALFGVVVLIATAFLGWRFATFAAINRLPRADADKSGVYEQMQKNIKRDTDKDQNQKQ
jgi:hypothetical protein